MRVRNCAVGKCRRSCRGRSGSSRAAIEDFRLAHSTPDQHDHSDKQRDADQTGRVDRTLGKA